MNMPSIKYAFVLSILIAHLGVDHAACANQVTEKIWW